jgi:CDP-6-deoxy-D-xylo-4-hexulose-3-dehydrase
MSRTFWLGLQPALSVEMLAFAAGKIESYLGIDF